VQILETVPPEVLFCDDYPYYSSFSPALLAHSRENVLELIQEGITFDEIVDKYYPDLEIEDIKACVKYATDLVKQEEVHLSVA